MTLCPVALAIGCRKCPVFSICPVKTVIGDQPSAPEPKEAKPQAAEKKARPPATKRRGRRKSR
jgi:hypothetical protein